MPRKFRPQTSPTVAPEAPNPESAAAPSGLTAEQLARWAELIAGGEAHFPGSLGRDQQRHLLELVRQRRRSRLVQFIARAIAQEIWRTHE